MNIDNEIANAANKGQAPAENAILPLQSKMNDNNPGPKTVEIDHVQQNPKRIVFYRCEDCPFLTMQSDLMHNHMEQPPAECVKAKNEKRMKQLQEAADRKRLLELEKSRKRLFLTSYRATRTRSIKPSVPKKNTNAVSRSKKVKSDLMDNRHTKKPPNQSRKSRNEQGTATTPIDLENSLLDGPYRTRYQTGLAGKLEKKRAKSNRPLFDRKQQIQTDGAPTKIPIPLPVLQLQQQQMEPPNLVDEKEAEETVEVNNNPKTPIPACIADLIEGNTMTEEMHVEDPLAALKLPQQIIEPPILIHAKEAQETVEVSNPEFQNLVPGFMESNMTMEEMDPLQVLQLHHQKEGEAYKNVAVCDPEMPISTPDIMEVNMIAQEDMDKEEPISILQLQQQKLGPPIFIQEKEAQETVEVDDPEMPISAPGLMEVNMMTDEEMDVVDDPLPVLQLRQHKFEPPVLSKTKKAFENIEICDPESMPIPAPDLMEVNMIAEEMDVVDPLPVFQLQHQQKMDPTVSIQEKEDQETVEVNDPEMPSPVPDLMKPPVITEANEAGKKRQEEENVVVVPGMSIPVLADLMVENIGTKETVVVDRQLQQRKMEPVILTQEKETHESVKVCDSEIAITPVQAEPMEGNMMTEEMGVVDPHTPVTFMSPLELLAIITGKTPAEEARKILRDKSSEFAHEKEICKLRLNLLQIDFNALRLGDPETNQVNQRELNLVIERARSMKARIDGLEDQLATFRKIEESLSLKLKESK